MGNLSRTGSLEGNKKAGNHHGCPPLIINQKFNKENCFLFLFLLEDVSKLKLNKRCSLLSISCYCCRFVHALSFVQALSFVHALSFNILTSFLNKKILCRTNSFR